MPRIKTATAITLLNMGMVNRAVIVHWEAPSIIALSNGSLGNPRSPARKISVTNGVHCQISATITPINASWGVARIGISCDRIFNCANSQAIMPNCGSSSKFEHHAGYGGRNYQCKRKQGPHHAKTLLVAVQQHCDQESQHKLDREADDRIDDIDKQSIIQTGIVEKFQPIIPAYKNQRAFKNDEFMKAKIDIVNRGKTANANSMAIRGKSQANGCSEIMQRGREKRMMACFGESFRLKLG